MIGEKHFAWLTAFLKDLYFNKSNKSFWIDYPEIRIVLNRSCHLWYECQASPFPAISKQSHYLFNNNSLQTNKCQLLEKIFIFPSSWFACPPNSGAIKVKMFKISLYTILTVLDMFVYCIGGDCPYLDQPLWLMKMVSTMLDCQPNWIAGSGEYLISIGF